MSEKGFHLLAPCVRSSCSFLFTQSFLCCVGSHGIASPFLLLLPTQFFYVVIFYASSVCRTVVLRQRSLMVAFLDSEQDDRLQDLSMLVMVLVTCNVFA